MSISWRMSVSFIRLHVITIHSSLVRAFKVYVRPVVEYCSVVWNAHYMKDIVALQRVQSRFTKRLPGMKALTYHQRLVKLRLQSLEFRRIRLDLVFAYKVIFNLVDVNRDEFFTVRINHSKLGHRYKLYVPYGKTTASQL